MSPEPAMSCRPNLPCRLIQSSQRLCIAIQVELDKETYPDSKNPGRGLFATRDIQVGQKMYDVWRFKGDKPDVVVVDSWEKVPANKRNHAFQWIGGQVVYPRSLRQLRYGQLVNHLQEGANLKGEILADEFGLENRGYIVFAMTAIARIKHGQESTMHCYEGRQNSKRFPDSVNPEPEIEEPPVQVEADKGTSSSTFPATPPSVSHLAVTCHVALKP